MLLAGGQGTRLGVLTSSVAKPAVPFGAKYRIIDFRFQTASTAVSTPSACLRNIVPSNFTNTSATVNRGIWTDSAAVSMFASVYGRKVGRVVQGHGERNLPNIDFIDNYSPDYVVILSGDHIYKMDYHDMLKEHKRNNADCTIAVRDVPIEEASRFGILNLKRTANK